MRCGGELILLLIARRESTSYMLSTHDPANHRDFVSSVNSEGFGRIRPNMPDGSRFWTLTRGCAAGATQQAASGLDVLAALCKDEPGPSDRGNGRLEDPTRNQGAMEESTAAGENDADADIDRATTPRLEAGGARPTSERQPTDLLGLSSENTMLVVG